MLETLVILFLILWLLGLITGNLFGGILHILLVAAVVIVIVRLITGRRAL